MATANITQVVVHPVVLLSVVDHYNRVAKDTKRRVVGVLLGEHNAKTGVVDVQNSYAVPFEEDAQGGKIWFLDHNFHESMCAMFRKVAAREQVVGWYSTGPKLRANDLAVHELMRRYTPHPTLVIIDVAPKELGLPTKAYVTSEELKEGTKTTALEFTHVASTIGALEAEEVGVEHLLRDIKDTSVSSLSTAVHSKLLALRSLQSRLEEMATYLSNVEAQRLPLNQTILRQIQEIFNLLPDLSAPALTRAFSVKTNDMMLVIYVSSLIRSVIALHNLLNNKLSNLEHERTAESKEREKDDAKKKKAADKDAAKAKDSGNGGNGGDDDDSKAKKSAEKKSGGGGGGGGGDDAMKE